LQRYLGCTVRPQGFSPSRRFSTTRTSWLCFAPHPPLGFWSSELFSSSPAAISLDIRCSPVVSPASCCHRRTGGHTWPLLSVIRLAHRGWAAAMASNKRGRRLQSLDLARSPFLVPGVTPATGRCSPDLFPSEVCQLDRRAHALPSSAFNGGFTAFRPLFLHLAVQGIDPFEPGSSSEKLLQPPAGFSPPSQPVRVRPR